MSSESASADSGEFSLATSLKRMCSSLMQYCLIHHQTIINQIRNTYETYLPMTLSSRCGLNINVNDFFDPSSFSQGRGDPASQDGQPRVIIISGSTHTGKSSLLHYLNYQWLIDNADDVKNIKQFSFVLYIDAKSLLLRSPSPMEVLEKSLVLKYFPKNMDAGEIIKALEKEKILWLVDNFYRGCGQNQYFVFNLLEHFPHSQMVVVNRLPYDEETEEIMNDAQIKCVSLRLEYPRFHDMELMVPKMVQTKTSDPQIISEASAKFTNAYRLSRLPHNAHELAIFVDRWMQIRYPCEHGTENLQLGSANWRLDREPRFVSRKYGKELYFGK
ncbi:uncharacterized protein [Macrobrachium rosenbergii]|uniref:uncharacterized protein n=1 Tax=Macrobrachium rosenbergii TaxID=79674 RepID=UPI0034D69D55